MPGTTPAEGYPTYAELLARRDAPAGTAWGVFGADDRLGTLNLIDAAAIVRSAALIRKGAVFRLDLPLDAFAPGLNRRPPPAHHVFATSPGSTASDDYLDGFYLQASSQWDALRHIKHREHGYYNATPEEDTGAPGQLGIDTFARRGIVGRGVLLDIDRYARVLGPPIEPRSVAEITPDMLRGCAEHQGVALEPGDVLMIRTGWLRYWLDSDASTRESMASNPGVVPSPGIGPADEMAAFLWDQRIAAVVSDNIAVEPSSTGGHLHHIVIPKLGLAIGELWNLEEVAADCAADGVYECFLASAPLFVTGGVGSPANALAIK